MIRLPNGNVVKFLDTNGKHFTVGDPVAFSIVKMGNKNPEISHGGLIMRAKVVAGRRRVYYAAPASTDTVG